MTGERDDLNGFREAYLDYLEGDRDDPPTLEGLTGEQRRAAEAFIESISAARGVDPYASRPSIEQLLAAPARDESKIEALGLRLQSQLRSDVDSLCDAQRVLKFDAQVSDGAVDLCVAKQELDRTEIPGLSVNLGRLCPPERMRSVTARFEPYGGNPVADQPSVLPR